MWVCVGTVPLSCCVEVCGVLCGDRANGLLCRGLYGGQYGRQCRHIDSVLLREGLCGALCGHRARVLLCEGLCERHCLCVSIYRHLFLQDLQGIIGICERH